MSSSRSWVFSAVVGGLVVCTVLGLAFVALVRKDQTEAPGGGELVFDDFGFRVLAVRTATAVGASGHERSASGRFWIVQLEVVNHAQRVDYDMSHHALLRVEDGHRYTPDTDAQDALRANGGLPAAPERIAAGTHCTQELVFDVPKSVEHPELKIAWGGPLIQMLEDTLLGDKGIALVPENEAQPR